MADPISILALSAAVVSALRLTNELVRIMKALREVEDPRVQMIHYRLLTQQQITLGWANRIRNGGSSSWNILPEAAEHVYTILEQMRKYYDLAESKMSRIRAEPDGRMTSRMFARRLWFANGGFEDLKNLIDALDSMNQALLVIAPPLPAYSSADPPLGPMEGSQISPQGPGQQTTTQKSNTSRDSFSDILEAKALPISIARLYKQCLESLQLLSRSNMVAVPNDTFLERPCELFRQWGVGIFDAEHPLINAILSEEIEEGRNLRNLIVRSLVYIAVIEVLEQLLLRKCKQSKEMRDPLEQELQHTRTSIAALLGSDSLNDMALEQWADFQTSLDVVSTGESVRPGQVKLKPRGKQLEHPQSESDELLSDNVAWENIKKETNELQSIVEASLLVEESDEIESSDGQHVNQINADDQLRRIIELLFDILPAIRSLRRDALLELERGNSEDKKAASLEKISDESETTSTGEIDQNFEQRLDHSLDLASGLETLLRNDETWAKKNNHHVKVYSPIFSKERERLQEFKSARRGDRRPGEVNQLLGTISGLEEALNKTLQDIEVREKLGIKPGEKQHTDIKFSGKDTDAKIAEVVKVFRNSNTALWVSEDEF